MDMQHFIAAKNKFVERHGEHLLTATEADRQLMAKELELLARFAKMPPMRLLAAIQTTYANTTQR